LDEEGEPIFEVLNTVTFVQKGDKTLVTVDARVIMATAGAGVFLQGMEEGWSQSLERLDDFVKEHLA
jgi:uncharacterized protein YndB with AHSA1/START domain